ncbi:MAG TPA: hypothetical protein VF593_06140 [Chthoniobacteraceae bacterium]|jgi:hypothetical protein
MELSTFILPFLGSRDYLHGTTLFDALLPFLPGDATMTFKFSKTIRSNCVQIAPERGEASLAWKSASAGAGALQVHALPSAEPLERRAYPESLVRDGAEITGESVCYEDESPFSFVSTLIPLHKALLAAHVQPSVPGQWVFTRLDLAERPASFRRIELQLAGVFQDQLAHSKISVEGQPIGAIYFSWLPKR